VGKVMKDHMDGAVKKGASMGKGLNANVFIKSIMALKSIDVSVQFGKRIQYYVDMRASSKEDGDRLMMVSHFFIVGASLAISFIDILGKSFGDGNSGGFQEKEMETIQGFFGRIGTRQVDKGVLLSFHLTEDETNMFITSAKKKIASEKNAQGIRLEREALATFINTIKKGDAAEVTAFLSKKININGKDINGNIPLHTACVAGKFNIVRLLVEKGAEINSQDFDMKTPLHRAVESGNPDIVAYILAKGANVQAKSISGNTPLHDNAIQGNEKITGLLIGKHADVNAKNQMGASPLHLASEHGHLIVVKALVEKGADINAYDNMGDRAIDRARRMEKHDIVNYLIERESNPLNSGDGNSSDGEGSSKQGDY
jgi:ankyrin repeat protein